MFIMYGTCKSIAKPPKNINLVHLGDLGVYMIFLSKVDINI